MYYYYGLKIILNLLPLDLYYRGPGASVNSHLLTTDQWHALSIGHTRILGEIDIVVSNDYIIPRYDFSMRFKTPIPKREEWIKGVEHFAGGSA